jgi:tartrate-resistant acid phosphatase type 5
MIRFLFLLLVWAGTGYTAKPLVAFVFMGDTGVGDKNQKAVAASIVNFCAKTPCEFIAQLGDNFYDAGVKSVKDPLWETAFEIPYKDILFPFRVALGNHDHVGNIRAQIDYSAHSKKWSLPSAYYSFSQGGADFFVLDTETFNAAQQKWLTDALAASTAAWKIVYGHHPIYSYGEHGHAPGLVRQLLPVLQDGGVDFYLAGHDHDKQVLQVGKLHLLISGGGGAPIRPTRKGRLSQWAKSSHGFGHIQIEDESATVQYRDTGGNEEFKTTYTK